MRIRQSPRPYEIVGDCSDKSCHWYQPLDRFVLQVVLARRCVMPSLCYLWWCMLFLINSLELNLLCDLYFTRFVLTKGLKFYIFFIVFSLFLFFWSLGIWIRIIFNTNELVYQARHWHQMPHRWYFVTKKMCSMWDFMWKECAFFDERMRCRQKLCR